MSGLFHVRKSLTKGGKDYSMGKILEALYLGNLLAEPIIEKRSEEHQKACDYAFGMLGKLSQKVSAEENEMLDKIVDALTDENQYYATERFVRGFCLGALIMIEIFEKRDELMIKEENS